MNELALAAYLSLFGADAATTHHALQRPNVREVFLTQSPIANDAILSAQAAGLYWATSKIKRPVLRWTVRFGIAGIHGYAAVHNLREVKRATR